MRPLVGHHLRRALCPPLALVFFQNSCSTGDVLREACAPWRTCPPPRRGGGGLPLAVETVIFGDDEARGRRGGGTRSCACCAFWVSCKFICRRSRRGRHSYWVVSSSIGDEGHRTSTYALISTRRLPSRWLYRGISHAQVAMRLTTNTSLAWTTTVPTLSIGMCPLVRQNSSRCG